MHIPPPNYTQVPNVIFDYWMNILTPAEFKVLLCICRKTFGWHKEKDSISLKQIEKMTGLSRFGISGAIKKLIESDLLLKIKSKTEDGDDAANQYSINVNCIGVGSQLSLLGVGNQVDQGGSQLRLPTKETPLNTKETLTNIPTNVGIAQTSKTDLPPKASPQISFSFSSRSFENIEEIDMTSWKEAYPASDVPRELKKMVEWILSNERKAKSKKHWRKFITNWLSSSNDKAINFQARSGSQTTQSTNPTKEANLEAFRSVGSYFASKGKKSPIYLKGNFVYHNSTGDSVSLDLQPSTFHDVLCGWCNLKKGD